MNTITIKEISELYNVKSSSVRVHIANNNIEPIFKSLGYGKKPSLYNIEDFNELNPNRIISKENYEGYTCAKCDKFINPYLSRRSKYGLHFHHYDMTMKHSNDPIIRNLYEMTKGTLNGFTIPMHNGCHSSVHKKGCKLTEEQCKARSKQLKGENNPFYGKKHSQETKDKIGKSTSKSLKEKYASGWRS
jgi:hypothetical protein